MTTTATSSPALDTYKISIKIPLVGPVPWEHVSAMFHSWIQLKALPDHQLIDIGDYQHVPAGPGIVVVGHEANLYLDNADNHPGILYFRKQPLPESTFDARLKQILRYTLTAAALVESNPALSALKLNPAQLIIRLNDRLLAPNQPETYTAIESPIAQTLTQIYGSSPTLKRTTNELQPAQLTATFSKSPTAQQLLAQL